MKLINSRIVRSNGGFSLIEVCLAVGVFVMGFVAVLGMLANGIQSSRSAADNCIPAMIADDIFNQVSANYVSYFAAVTNQSAGLTQIADKTGTQFQHWEPAGLGTPNAYLYYDVYGNLSTITSKTTPPSNAYYRVYVHYTTPPANAHSTMAAVNSLTNQAAVSVFVIWPAAPTATFAQTNEFNGQVLRKYSEPNS